jgi:Periplasmic protease
VYAQTISTADSINQKRLLSLELIKTKPYRVWDVPYVQKEDWRKLYRVPNHPAFDSLLTTEIEANILSDINARRKELDKDTLFSADFYYCWKPYFDWLNNEDPHYRVGRARFAPNKKLAKEMSKTMKDSLIVIPFSSYLINDTLLVSKSYDKCIMSGDMILSVNDIPISKLIDYGHKDRYVQINLNLIMHNFEIASEIFDIKLLRDNNEMSIETKGIQYDNLLTELIKEEYNPTVYQDANCGYVQIKEFYPNNSRLIKIVKRAILDFKRQGLKNVIIDLRRNPGGSGHKLDELLSMFINKPSIPYLKGQKLKVSEKTLADFDFITEDMLGKNITIPDKYIVKDIPLNNKLFIDGINFYVLISMDTGSTAASFANILQYNKAAQLVGEPLRRNALKYGEIIGGNSVFHTLIYETGVSTTEFNEHTDAVDGFLMPDIPIPYVAKEYMTGRDAVLDKLLEIIKNK